MRGGHARNSPIRLSIKGNIAKSRCVELIIYSVLDKLFVKKNTYYNILRDFFEEIAYSLYVKYCKNLEII